MSRYRRGRSGQVGNLPTFNDARITPSTGTGRLTWMLILPKTFPDEYDPRMPDHEPAMNHRIACLTPDRIRCSLILGSLVPRRDVERPRRGGRAASPRRGLCDRRLAQELPGPGQRRLPPGHRHQGERPAAGQVPGARRRHDPAGDRRRRQLHDASRPARSGQGPGAGEDGNPHGEDADLGDPHSLGPGRDGRAGVPGRSGVCRALARADRRGDRAGQRRARPGARGLGVGRRRQAHLLPAVDPPARQDDRRSLRQPDRAGEYAPGLCESRRHRPVRSRRPRADLAVDPDPRGQARRRPGQLLAALLRGVAGLGRLLRPVRDVAGEADRCGAGG